jgi:hypothetical protein
MAKKEKISAALKLAVRDARNCCAACGTPDAFDCGHIVAETRGGKAELSNLILMCDRCNGALNHANFEFIATANYTESWTVIQHNRAAFFAYADKAKLYWAAQDKLAKGEINSNPYRKPKAFRPE